MKKSVIVKPKAKQTTALPLLEVPAGQVDLDLQIDMKPEFDVIERAKSLVRKQDDSYGIEEADMSISERPYNSRYRLLYYKLAVRLGIAQRDLRGMTEQEIYDIVLHRYSESYISWRERRWHDFDEDQIIVQENRNDAVLQVAHDFLQENKVKNLLPRTGDYYEDFAEVNRIIEKIKKAPKPHNKNETPLPMGQFFYLVTINFGEIDPTRVIRCWREICLKYPVHAQCLESCPKAGYSHIHMVICTGEHYTQSNFWTGLRKKYGYQAKDNHSINFAKIDSVEDCERRCKYVGKEYSKPTVEFLAEHPNIPNELIMGECSFLFAKSILLC